MTNRDIMEKGLCCCDIMQSLCEKGFCLFLLSACKSLYAALVAVMAEDSQLKSRTGLSVCYCWYNFGQHFQTIENGTQRRAQRGEKSGSLGDRTTF